MDKEEILQTFLKRHPEFKRYSLSRLEKSLMREKRREHKLEVLKQIAELKYKNKKTAQAIARIVGISTQVFHKKIDKYLR